MDNIRKIAVFIILLTMLMSVSYAQEYVVIAPQYCMIKEREKYEPKEENIVVTYPEPTKTAYLTFDDGPSKNITPLVLDILKDHDVRATFFTLGKSMEQYPELTRRILDEGHGIGNHSYSHNYDNIYSGLEGFEWEIRAWDRVYRDITGRKETVRLFRFPGGSHTKADIYKDYLADIGYDYYDWNALNGDSEMKIVTKEHLKKRTMETLKGQDEIIFLMHDSDGKMNTASTLPDLIHTLRMQGYDFRILN